MENYNELLVSWIKDLSDSSQYHVCEDLGDFPEDLDYETFLISYVNNLDEYAQMMLCKQYKLI